jgi:hypothetical protein
MHIDAEGTLRNIFLFRVFSKYYCVHVFVHVTGSYELPFSPNVVNACRTFSALGFEENSRLRSCNAAGSVIREP